MVVNAKKVILKTYYCLNGEYILFEDNPLHNTTYENVQVAINQITQKICDIEFECDVIAIEEQEPIICEFINIMELDDKLIIKLCQDWG